jgi:hypothetical protein
VYHEAPVALPYFARFAAAAGFPGTAAHDGTLVQPFTWTKLSYIIDPSQIGSTLTPEAAPGSELATYNSTFSNVGRVQIGFTAPASMANSANAYLYAIDHVSAVPEPTTAFLLLAAAVFTISLRKRAK